MQKNTNQRKNEYASVSKNIYNVKKDTEIAG